MSRKLLALAGLFISLMLLWFSIKDLSFENLTHTLGDANLYWLFLMLPPIALFFILKTIRWQQLFLPIQHLSFSTLTPSLILGTAGGYITFPYIGEAVRLFVLARAVPLSRGAIGATICLEKLLDIAMILILVAIGSVLLPHELPILTRAAWGVSAITALFFLIVALAILRTEPFLRLCEKGLFFLSPATKQGYLDRIKRALQGFHSLLSLHLMVKISLLTVLLWLFMASIHYLSFLAVGINPPFLTTFLIIGIIVCGFALPTLPGQIGLIEFSYVAVLGFYGVAPVTAFAAAILYHLILYFTVWTAGIFYYTQVNND